MLSLIVDQQHNIKDIAFYYLGMIQRINNNYEASLKYLNAALKIDNNFSKAHFEIAMLYKDMIYVDK